MIQIDCTKERKANVLEFRFPIDSTKLLCFLYRDSDFPKPDS